MHEEREISPAGEMGDPAGGMGAQAGGMGAQAGGADAPAGAADAPATRVRWDTAEPFWPPVIRAFDVLLRLAYDVRVGGSSLPPTGPVVVAGNHVHHLDAVVFGTVANRQGRRLRFLALAELWDIPAVGWVLREGRMIPVRRGAGPFRMVTDARRALRAGQAVLVYPEGHIARGRQLPALPGAGLLALTGGVPVVPMAVWGLGAPHRPARRGLRPRLGVVVGEPVDLSAWAGRSDAEASRQAAEAVLAAVRDLLPGAARLARRRTGWGPTRTAAWRSVRRLLVSARRALSRSTGPGRRPPGAPQGR
jgi:1-acyl-sn-glycerol-3-phosphate acyltransferase